jgi:hypothetical protein
MAQIGPIRVRHAPVPFPHHTTLPGAEREAQAAPDGRFGEGDRNVEPLRFRLPIVLRGLTIDVGMSKFDPGSHPPAIPVPAQALAYSTPLPYYRPGIVTAIGVMAIVVGCLSLFANFSTGMGAWGLMMVSRISTTMSRSAAARSSASPPPTAPATPLSVGEVGVAVNTLSPMLALDGPHDRELNRMLRLHGREIFGNDEDTPLTGAQVRQAVTLSRKMSRSGSPAAQFITAQGKVDVFAGHAVFTSTDGTIIDSSARDHSDSTQATAHAATRMQVTTLVGPGGVSVTSVSKTLTPAQVRSIVSAVKAAAKSPLNPAQVKAVQAELSKPNQLLVTAGRAAPVPAVVSQPGGNVTVYFNTGNTLVLGPAGQVVSSGPPPMPKFNVNTGLALLVMIEAILSAALAIYLIVVGIIVLRGSFHAPRLLRIYGWTKIVLAIVAGVGMGTMMYQFYSGMSNMPGVAGSGASLGPIGAIYGIVLGLLGLAFPIGVLIALRSRTVQSYFNAVVGANG